MDIVAYGAEGLLAMEIERTARVAARDAGGQALLRRDYPEARCSLLYGGDKRLYWPEADVWPVEEALSRLSELLSPE